MQLAFLIILISTLGAGVLVLGWMGWSQRRRKLALARVAHEMGMMFSAKDPFELTRRYSSFVLASAGHSSRAENVIYGRYKGWYVRAFDYRFEAGHGPRRLVRRYSVIVSDTHLEAPPTLMWHEQDADHVPLAVQNPLARLGGWLVVSGRGFAPALAGAFAGFAAEAVNLQADRRWVMLCSARRWKPADFAARIDRAAAALGALRARVDGA